MIKNHAKFGSSLKMWATAAALGASLVGTATAQTADKITIQLDFTYIRGNYAPFYVGRDKGIFKEENIEVTEIRLRSRIRRHVSTHRTRDFGIWLC